MFRPCYSVLHWNLPPITRLSMLALHAQQNLLKHFPVIHEPTFRMDTQPGCLAFASACSAGTSGAQVVGGWRGGGAQVGGEPDQQQRRSTRADGRGASHHRGQVSEPVRGRGGRAGAGQADCDERKDGHVDAHVCKPVQERQGQVLGGAGADALPEQQLPQQRCDDAHGGGHLARHGGDVGAPGGLL